MADKSIEELIADATDLSAEEKYLDQDHESPKSEVTKTLEAKQNDQANTNSKEDDSVEEVPLNFAQLRQKFEEKCKPNLKVVTMQPKRLPTLGTQTLDETMKTASEFQKLYSAFKEFFTKRQFASIETCFNLADINQDGFLDSKEVKQLMIDCQQPVNLCEADIIVSLGDHDQDGKLSPKEFLELCKPSAKVIREHHHMEGSCPPANEEFTKTIIEKLRSSSSPVNSRVKGTRQFFENIICSPTNLLCGTRKEANSSPRKTLKFKPHTCAHNTREQIEAKESVEVIKPPYTYYATGELILNEDAEEDFCQMANNCC